MNMTEQDVFDMARKVCGKWPSFMSNPNLQAFAKLVAAKEREACAKVCEKDDSMRWSGAADAIRARNKT